MVLRGGMLDPRKEGCTKVQQSGLQAYPGARILLRKTPPFRRMVVQGSSVHRDRETIERIMPKDRGLGDESEVRIVRQTPEDFAVVGYVVRNLSEMGPRQRLR